VASGSFTSVNLSQLPAPAVIEVLDFETLFDESLTALQALDPTFDALLPSVLLALGGDGPVPDGHAVPAASALAL